ncbi:hypothetical protein BDZ45DRAFT_751628 [Acephala macrosclerotiorum]|nr:hypothetical protein BDZ45DRAFT_751628 [Acephala macrosclerotiorum]
MQSRLFFSIDDLVSHHPSTLVSHLSTHTTSAAALGATPTLIPFDPTELSTVKSPIASVMTDTYTLLPGPYPSPMPLITRITRYTEPVGGPARLLEFRDLEQNSLTISGYTYLAGNSSAAGFGAWSVYDPCHLTTVLPDRVKSVDPTWAICATTVLEGSLVTYQTRSGDPLRPPNEVSGAESQVKGSSQISQALSLSVLSYLPPELSAITSSTLIPGGMTVTISGTIYSQATPSGSIVVEASASLTSKVKFSTTSFLPAESSIICIKNDHSWRTTPEDIWYRVLTGCNTERSSPGVYHNVSIWSGLCISEHDNFPG